MKPLKKKSSELAAKMKKMAPQEAFPSQEEMNDIMLDNYENGTSDVTPEYEADAEQELAIARSKLKKK